MTTERRVALVTGANKGIGKHIARQLAQQGLLVLMVHAMPPAVRLPSTS